MTTTPVTITFLGGLGEIGRNCAAIEIDNRIMLLDCGLMFPDYDMLGIDVVLPDFSWLMERADRIEGCILTHGHEDHVGALSYALAEMSFPIIGSALSLGLARGRIEEAGLLRKTELITEKGSSSKAWGACYGIFASVAKSSRYSASGLLVSISAGSAAIARSTQSAGSMLPTDPFRQFRTVFRR